MAKKKVAKKAVKSDAEKSRSRKRIQRKKQPDASCFVLMPFREPFNRYYSTIFEPAVKAVNLKPLRGDSLYRPSPIMGDVWKMTQDADVLLAELTTQNANVFYELGLAHAIGKPVILVSETMDDVPFDLRPLRVLTYDKNDPAWGAQLKLKITESLKEILDDAIEAVPPMYRKMVKSQAPEDSELNLRLAALEQKVRTVEDRTRPQLGQLHGFPGLSQPTWGLSVRTTKARLLEQLRSIAKPAAGEPIDWRDIFKADE